MTEDRNDAARTQLAHILRGRRSIDLFEPEPVGTAELIRAIELARWAPNHRLTEPWRFYLLGAQTISKFTELAAELEAVAKGPAAGEARRKRLQGVPGFFVLTSLRSDEALVDRENYAACCCAAQNLMLYLWQCEIGVKWTTGEVTRHPRFYELLGVDPAAETVVGFFWYGRPRVVPTQKRRPLDAIIRDLP
jgi:nitroreductase